MATITIKSPEELKEIRKNRRLETWKTLFTDQIYMVLNRVNPGMKLEVDAVQFISKILIHVLHEFVEESPETISAVQIVMKKLFPSAWATFVVKHTDFKDLIDKPWIKRKLKDDKSKEAKITSILIQKLKSIMKENSGKVVDDRVVCYIQSVLDEIANDVLKWTSMTINKFHSEKREISKFMLIAAIYTDRGLSELMEKLLPGANSDYCAIDIYQQTTATTTSERQSTRQLWYDYDAICHKFEIDENSFLRDLSILVNVFKRRLEKGLGDDAAGRQYISSIFGNINDIYELTFRILRAIEEVREMPQTQSMGTGLSEFAEGCEFDSYVRFMEIFKEPIEEKVNAMLKDKRYTAFFDEEDKISFTPDGQCMRMAFRYVLPLYLHSVAAHFDGYYHYVTLLIKGSKPGPDRVELQNLETHLKSVSSAINTLELPQNPHKRYSRLRDDAQRAQHMSNIQRIQRSIENWEGKVIGFMCTEFIREGNLNVLHQSSSMKDQIRGKSWSERHVFLFDYLLVLVKNLKSGGYKYKQQIKVQCCDIFDLCDDDDLKNAFRIRVESRQNPTENTDIILFCKSAEEKHDWLTSILEMQTAGILHRLLDSYNREMEIRTPLMLPSTEQYRFAEPDTDDNINFEDYMRNSGIPVVKNGTIIKLVERLTYPGYSDNDYIKTFFMTYRTFCSPQELFGLLVERFNIPLPLSLSHFEAVQSPPPIGRSGGPLAGRYDTVQSHGLTSTYHEQAFMRFRREFQKPIQIKVFFAINHWVNHHFYDFVHDPLLLQKVKDFLSGKDGKIRLTNDHIKTCRKLLNNISKKEDSEVPEESATKAIIAEQNGLTGGGYNGGNDGDTPTTKRKNGRTLVGNFPEILWHYAKKDDISNYDLLTLHPVEIGRQMTLLHFYFFASIKPIELVGAVFTKKNKNESPQLKKMVRHSNMLTWWIVKSIVETECIDERTEMISRILEILYVLEQFNNFNGMLAFVAALANSAIHRLQKSKALLNKEKQDLYKHFWDLCSKDGRQTEIKKRLRTVNPPCVPFPGSLMTQLVFFEEQHRTLLDEREEQSKKLISFVKCRKVAEIIKGAQLYQSQQYMFRAEPSILQFFENLNPLKDFHDEEEFKNYLHNQSLRIEPKEGTFKGKPKYAPEVLKSPGVKIPTKTAPRHHSSSAKSPKSPSALSIPQPAHSPDDSHFGIVDITPGQLPKYIGDSGRINQGFSNDTPLQTPTGLIRRTPSGSTNGRKMPLSSSNKESSHFSFPPMTKMLSSNTSMPPANVFPTTMAPDAIVLNKPPAGRRRPPPPPTNGTLTRRAPPPIPCEPGSSKLSTSPPKLTVDDSLTEVIKLKPNTNGTTPPKSPSVSLSVPLPKERRDSETYSFSNPGPEPVIPAICPPRPPKSGSKQEQTSNNEGGTPPPLPPKTYKKIFSNGGGSSSP